MCLLDGYIVTIKKINFILNNLLKNSKKNTNYILKKCIVKYRNQNIKKHIPQYIFHNSLLYCKHSKILISKKVKLKLLQLQICTFI